MRVIEILENENRPEEFSSGRLARGEIGGSGGARTRNLCRDRAAL